MFRVGLTGNIASGKSSVAEVWTQAGAAVIDADVLAREAVAPGSPGLDRVREAFGDGVVVEGALDRDAMRRRVFDDPEARERLEAIIHPEVARLREREEARLRERGVDVVVHDIPLLFEVGLEDDFDMIVLVDAPREVRRERLMRGRGLGRDEARSMINAQMPTGVKRGRADVVIDNADTLDALRTAATAAWAEVQRRAGSGKDPSAGWVRLDMHVHTRTSPDSRLDPETALQTALDRGLHRICITDHNDIRAAVDLADANAERVIVGEEVRTREGVDLIGLYLTEWIPKGAPARTVCEQIRAQGGLVYLPHPFGGRHSAAPLLEELEDLVDVVEGFNARVHRSGANDRALQWARARNLPVGAGSAAHTLGEIGNAHVLLPAFNNEPGSLLAALERGSIHGTEASRWVHVASAMARFWP